MIEQPAAIREAPHRPSASARAVLTTSVFTGAEIGKRVGDDCYSYYFVQRAFAPLLERWGLLEEVSDPPRLLERVLEQKRQGGLEALHLSFLPLQTMHLAHHVPNIAFPFWEFPDIPAYDVAGNPRNNWVRMSERLSLILTACRFTRDAFVRAGVQTPVRVVPVPIRPDFFHTPPWEPDQRTVIECRCFAVSGAAPLGVGAPSAAGVPLNWRQRARLAYKHRLKAYLPQRVGRCLARAGRVALGRGAQLPPPYEHRSRLELSGIVYTTIFNPFDQRKNWRALMAAFLRAVGDRPDATLVIKMAVNRRLEYDAVKMAFDHYRELECSHRCHVVVVSAYLSDAQMAELARASTYYLNASRAEGACLPIQDFLAAGRPAITPSHTAIAEYADDHVGFVVASRPEPTHWLWDPQRRPTTTWHQVDEQSLAEQIQTSYETARSHASEYRNRADAGRRRMEGFASQTVVWPRLSEALDSVLGR